MEEGEEEEIEAGCRECDVEIYILSTIELGYTKLNVFTNITTCIKLHINSFVKYSSAACQQFSLTSTPTGTYSCPGSNIIYTCVVSSSADNVITIWSGSACLSNYIYLIQRSHGTILPSWSDSIGSISAVTTSINSTCYTSVLTIPAVEALNCTTVVCKEAYTENIVGRDTLKITSCCWKH